MYHAQLFNIKSYIALLVTLGQLNIKDNRFVSYLAQVQQSTCKQFSYQRYADQP